jgi:hypothetical protein
VGYTMRPEMERPGREVPRHSSGRYVARSGQSRPTESHGISVGTVHESPHRSESMEVSVRRRSWACAALVLVLVGSSAGLWILPGAAAAGTGSHALGSPAVLPGTTLVSAPPTWAKGPDDLGQLAVHGLDSGRALIWTAFQNGINPNGTPGTPFGPTQSTVAGYDPLNGHLVRTINVSGKVDAFAADRVSGKLIATVNEDANSALNVIDPGTGSVTTYMYRPSPEVSGNGGTDSVSVVDGRILIAHSNPNDATQATEYKVVLHPFTLIAQLTPVFFDNSWATSALTGLPVQLALTDPDTNFILPRVGERFGGDLATVNQADGKIVFAAQFRGTAQLEVLNLTDNVTGNVPPIDGLAVATCARGTLYVVDAAAGTIQALDTAGWAKGTVFVAEPSDNANPLIGVLNLHTGVITSLGNHFVSPKGLLFAPGSGCGDHDSESGQLSSYDVGGVRPFEAGAVYRSGERI